MYAIGIDIGGTNTDIGLVNPQGEVVARKNLPTGQYTDANQYADDLANTIKALIDEQKVEVKGIGIGAPNGNFYTGCIENAPNLNMKGNIYLAKMMEERLHIPAVRRRAMRLIGAVERGVGDAARGVLEDVDCRR